MKKVVLEFSPALWAELLISNSGARFEGMPDGHEAMSGIVLGHVARAGIEARPVVAEISEDAGWIEIVVAKLGKVLGV